MQIRFLEGCHLPPWPLNRGPPASIYALVIILQTYFTSHNREHHEVRCRYCPRPHRHGGCQPRAIWTWLWIRFFPAAPVSSLRKLQRRQPRSHHPQGRSSPCGHRSHHQTRRVHRHCTYRHRSHQRRLWRVRPQRLWSWRVRPQRLWSWRLRPQRSRSWRLRPQRLRSWRLRPRQLGTRLGQQGLALKFQASDGPNLTLHSPEYSFSVV